MALRLFRILSVPRPPIQNHISFANPVRTYAKAEKKKTPDRVSRWHELPKDLQALSGWLSHFVPERFPKHVCSVTFSRSSGPGGQNVNKCLRDDNANVG
jgi:peptidyl-tRNA hydrolase ICT1